MAGAHGSFGKGLHLRAAGDESPWLPGFHVYHQGPDGDWSGAFARLAQKRVAEFAKQ